MRPALLASFAWLALCATTASLFAADADWQLFATSKSAKVYYDRASLHEDGDYVRYAVRVEFAEPRESKTGKFVYQSAVSQFAARCDKLTYATTEVTLYDSKGAELTEQRRGEARWKAMQQAPKPNGLQIRLIRHVCKEAGREVAEDDKEAQKKRIRATLGAGIVANRDGSIVTNHHVVSGCATITVLDDKKKRHSATLVASDLKNDLALLRADGRFAKAATFRRDDPIEAGESVTVVGYPLAAILGTDPNVNFGYVTALAGLGGDSTRFQVAAPIQKGNSGGPVLDQSGRVAGIVTAKLNPRVVEQRTGDTPQNIGFAVRGELAQSFLERYDVRLNTAADGSKLENTAVAAIGRAVTVLVACRKNDP